MDAATPLNEERASPKEKLCAVCKKHDVQRLNTCARCRGIWYCSSGCQAEDWKVHRLLCKAYSEAIRPQDPAGSKVYRRVIFFHPDNNTPEIQWREFPGEKTLEELLEKGSKSDPTRKSQLATHFTWPMQPPGVIYGYDLQIVSRLQASTDGSTLNKSIAATAERLFKMAPFAWKGPVILTRQGIKNSWVTETDRNLSHFVPGCGYKAEDITMADFRGFVEWVVEYQGGQGPSNAAESAFWAQMDRWNFGVPACDQPIPPRK